MSGLCAKAGAYGATRTGPALVVSSVRASGAWKEMVNKLYSDGSDVICLQDVGSGDKDELFERLARYGYKKCVYCKKKRGVFCKSNDLLIASRYKILSWNYKLFDATTPLSSHLSNGIIYAIIEPIDGVKVCIVNTHIDDFSQKLSQELILEAREKQMKEIDDLLDALESNANIVILCGLLCDSAITEGEHKILISEDSTTAKNGDDENKEEEEEEEEGGEESSTEKKSEMQQLAEAYLKVGTSKHKHKFDSSNPANVELINRIMAVEAKKAATIPGLYPYLVYTPILVPKVARTDSNAYKLISANPFLGCKTTSIAYPDNNTSELSKATGKGNTFHINRYRDPLVESTFGYVPITENDICCADLEKMGLTSEAGDYRRLLWPRIHRKERGKPTRNQYILLRDTNGRKSRMLRGYKAFIDTMEIDTITRLPLSFDDAYAPSLAPTKTHSANGYAVVVEVSFSQHRAGC